MFSRHSLDPKPFPFHSRVVFIRNFCIDSFKGVTSLGCHTRPICNQVFFVCLLVNLWIIHHRLMRGHGRFYVIPFWAWRHQGVTHVPLVMKSFCLFLSDSKNNKSQSCAWQWTTLCPFVSSLDLITPYFFPFVFSEIFSFLPFHMIKPWSRIGFIHSLRWPHPLLMTPSARKQTPYIDFIF